jgi:hypothetical protein
VQDVFVEEARTFSFQDAAVVKRPGPLYTFPFLFIAKGSAPALGIARHALDALIDSVAKKPARRYTLGDKLEPPKVPRDDVFVQDAVGRVETQLASARAYQFEVMGDLWSTLVNGGNLLPCSLPALPPPIRTWSASASKWCNLFTRRQVAQRFIRRDRSIAVSATS